MDSQEMPNHHYPDMHKDHLLEKPLLLNYTTTIAIEKVMT